MGSHPRHSVPKGTIRKILRASRGLREPIRDTIPDMRAEAEIPVWGVEAGRAELAGYHARAAQGNKP